MRSKAVLGAAALLTAMGGGLLSAFGGCTLIYSADTNQCQQDADCTARGPEFEGTFCNEHKACVSSLTYCKTNSECIDRNGGQPYICRKDEHVCIPVLDENCTELHAEPDDLRNDEVVIVGLMLSPASNQFFAAASNSAELARRDFVQASGLPPAAPDRPRRPIVTLECSAPLSNTERMLAAARHLVHDVRVPAIIGPISSGDVQVVAAEVALPGKTLLLLPSGTSDFLRELPGRQDLMYRFSTPDFINGEAMGKLLTGYIEPLVRQREEIPAEEPIRVAVLHSSTAFGLGMSTTLFRALEFNGKPASDNGDNYQDLDYGDPAKPSPEVGYAKAVSGTVAFKPHVVVLAGATEVGTIYQLVQGEETADFRPFYISTLAGVAGIPPFVSTEDQRLRLLGVIPQPSSEDPLWKEYLLRYNSVFPDRTTTPKAELSAHVADAMYMLAYAVAANGDKDVNGENLGKAFRHLLPPGEKVTHGPGTINKSFQIIAEGRRLDYEGVTNACDFDELGDNLGFTLFWCLLPDTSLPDRSHDTGLYFDAEAGALAGQMSCPGFPAVTP